MTSRLDGGIARAARMAPCPFCERVAAGDLVAENRLAAAFPDAFPLNPGHCLIVPKRHAPDFLALGEEEQAAVWQLVLPVRRHLESHMTPAGYNLGVNIGEAAGQTVAHAHLHVIPRFAGDVPDPPGGIRWIIPDRARYWQRP